MKVLSGELVYTMPMVSTVEPLYIRTPLKDTSLQKTLSLPQVYTTSAYISRRISHTFFCRISVSIRGVPLYVSVQVCV